MYAIQNSFAKVSKSIIKNNAGWSSGIFYALANSDKDSIIFEDCEISNNVANSINFYITTSDMKLERCNLINNRCLIGSHGFELVQSLLTVSESKIEFTDDYL